MPNTAEALRRWMGMFFLAIASGMLIWGRTFLAPHLSGHTFLLYWTLCVLAACLAVGFGVADIWLTLRAVRDQRRKSLRNAFEQIRRADDRADDPRD